VDEHRSEGGFTLVELMISVAVIGVLAKLVLPTWFKESTRGTAKSEVVAVFAALTGKELNYQATKGVYLAASACPATSTGTQQDISACSASGGVWNALGTVIPNKNVYCSYTITTGTASQTPTPPAGFTMTAPATTWFYVTATCLIGGTTYKFFASSVDTSLQMQ
jgi:prepilin-type N-terminal cleavage/methylation domain-containing protein